MPTSARRHLRIGLLAAFVLLPEYGGIAAAADLSGIDTIVVLYPENRSFDHLYGLFPGANGIAKATMEQYTQRDHDGSVLPYLRVWDAHGKPDARFPELPNAPFRIDAPPVGLSSGAPLVGIDPLKRLVECAVHRREYLGVLHMEFRLR